MLVALTGCYSDFEPDIESTPVVCINANAKVGEQLMIFVTRTWRWSEHIEESSLDLKDANVVLYVNDSEYEEVKYKSREYYNPLNPMSNLQWGYLSDYIPRSGDKIRIVVHSNEYGDAEGEVIVPDPVEIEDVQVSADIKTSDNGEFRFYTGQASLLLYFTDPADITNYYLVGSSLSGAGVELQYTAGYINYDSEPLFTEHVSSLESALSNTYGLTIFSDRMISGKRYPLHLRLEDITYPIKISEGFDSNQSSVCIRLTSISESYYRHVISVWERNEGVNGILEGIGLADPVWECSNVSTGAGVISASALFVINLPLSSIVSD